MAVVKRVVMRVDATGRLGLAVIRHGAPVEGVRSGAPHELLTAEFLTAEFLTADCEKTPFACIWTGC